MESRNAFFFDWEELIDPLFTYQVLEIFKTYEDLILWTPIFVVNDFIFQLFFHRLCMKHFNSSKL